jgi:hypothetical protein
MSKETDTTISTYIFVHNQNIILDFLNKNRFLDFQNVNYVFLGNKKIDKLNNLKNIIVARDLPHNIEHYPNLTSFTGWYALCKNNLINTEYVNLFEYDINYHPNFVSKNQQLIESAIDAAGYLCLSVNNPYFLHPMFTEPFISELKKRENIDIHQTVQHLKNKNPNLQWPVTSNSTWKKDILFNYVNWFSEYIDTIGATSCAGHIAERSISFYYFINKINVALALNLIEHLQLNSHMTDPNIPKTYDKFTAEYHKIKKY